METPAFVCSHVCENTRAVLLVSRADSDWQLLCGGNHDTDEVPRVVGLNHLFERDPTLLELQDLPVGWEAERTHVGGEWLRMQIPAITQ